MTIPLEAMIEADCSVLLLRALYQKTAVAFGEDGLGKHGTCDRPQYYKIEDIAIDIALDDDDEPMGIVSLALEGYNSKDHGHICTDQNFLISVRNFLIGDHIDPTCVEYAELDVQGEDFVTLNLDVGLLLDWA